MRYDLWSTNMIAADRGSMQKSSSVCEGSHKITNGMLFWSWPRRVEFPCSRSTFLSGLNQYGVARRGNLLTSDGHCQYRCSFLWFVMPAPCFRAVGNFPRHIQAWSAWKTLVMLLLLLSLLTVTVSKGLDSEFYLEAILHVRPVAHASWYCACSSALCCDSDWTPTSFADSSLPLGLWLRHGGCRFGTARRLLMWLLLSVGRRMGVEDNCELGFYLTRWRKR
jgi:hypothetical protein